MVVAGRDGSQVAQWQGWLRSNRVDLVDQAHYNLYATTLAWIAWYQLFDCIPPLRGGCAPM